MKLLRVSARRVSATFDNGQAGIFGERGIGLREFAQIELRAALGFDFSRVEAIGAQASARAFIRSEAIIRH